MAYTKSMALADRRRKHQNNINKINSKFDKAILNINLCKPTSMSKTPTPYDSDSESRDSKKKKEEQ